MDIKTMLTEIDIARETLKRHGYYVENLWHIEDVFPKHDCSDEEAYQILDDALRNEATYSQIWLSIDYAIENKKHTKTHTP